MQFYHLYFGGRGCIMYLQGKEKRCTTMGMEKAIKSGKEHRKEYRGAKAIAKSCRNGGSCKWCRMNRMYKNLKKMQKSIDK